MIKAITISRVMLPLFLIAIPIGSSATLEAQTPGTLYASTGSVGGALITVDTANGTGTSVGTIGTFGPVTEIEFRNDGELFGSTGMGTSHIITINPLTGAEDTIGTHPFGSVNGLEFDGSGNLWGTFFDGTTSNLVIVDQSTGQFTTTVGPTGVQVISGLALHPNGTLYGVGHLAGGSASNLYTINTTTGAATLVGAVGFESVGALEFGPNGVLYGGVGSLDPNFAGHLITIDPATGGGTDVGSTGFAGISGLSFVPEPTSIHEDPQVGTPNEFALRQNYPNPFNPVTHINFGLPYTTHVKIEVFDILGNKILTLLDASKPAGNHTIDFDGGNLASGLYLYRIQAGEFVQMKKMVLLR